MMPARDIQFTRRYHSSKVFVFHPRGHSCLTVRASKDPQCADDNPYPCHPPSPGCGILHIIIKRKKVDGFLAVPRGGTLRTIRRGFCRRHSSTSSELDEKNKGKLATSIKTIRAGVLSCIYLMQAALDVDPCEQFIGTVRYDEDPYSADICPLRRRHSELCAGEGMDTRQHRADAQGIRGAGSGLHSLYAVGRWEKAA